MHRYRPTPTALAAVLGTLAVAGSSAAAPIGVVVDESRRGDFNNFGNVYNPQWIGDVAWLKEKGKGVKAKQVHAGVDRSTPGRTVPGSNGFSGTRESAASYAAADFNADIGFFYSTPGWSTVDTRRLLNPFRVEVDPSADVIGDADVELSFDFIDSTAHLATTTKARAKLDGAKGKAGTADTADVTNTLHDGLHRFSEVVLDQKKGKDRVLANGSAVAEGDYIEGRASARVVGQPDAKGKASAHGVIQATQTYDIVRTQVLELNASVNVRGGGRVNLELVDLNADQTLVSWTSDRLARDGRYDIDLLTAIDAGDGRDGVADLELRVSAVAAASGKAKSSKLSELAAAEYSISDALHDPSGYVAPQWTYTPASWTALNGPNAGQTVSVGEAIVVTGGYDGDLPDTVVQNLPFDPATLGTDAYHGAYVLHPDIRAALSGPLADALLTPHGDGKYFVSFGDDVVVQPSSPSGLIIDLSSLDPSLVDLFGLTPAADAAAADRPEYGDVRGHLLDLYDALIAQGFAVDDVAAALLIDPDTEDLSYLRDSALALDGRDEGEYVSVRLVEAFGPVDWLWEPLEISDYEPGYWALTREEVMPSAEEALAAYALEHGIDLAIADDIGIGHSSLSAGTRLAVSLAIGEQVPEDLSIYGSAWMTSSADPVVNPTPTAAAGGLAGMVLLLRRRRLGRG
ncbi:MAG: hypothetical protein AAGK09_13975 [Planctomycetota bacterium]